MKNVRMADLEMKRLTWSQLFDSEDELIEAMMLCKADPEKYPYWQLVNGYEYISSFQRQYAEKGSLTAKQITQLKRLAKSVYRGVLGE